MEGHKNQLCKGGDREGLGKALAIKIVYSLLEFLQKNKSPSKKGQRRRREMKKQRIKKISKKACVF